MAGWTESLHPRAPKGKTGGGRFASAPGGGAPAKTAGGSGKVTGRPGPMARAQAHQNAARNLRGQMRLLGQQIRSAQKAAAASVTQTAHMGPLPVGPITGSVSGGSMGSKGVSLTIPKPKKAAKGAKSTTGLPIVTGTTTSVAPSNTITPPPLAPAASLPLMRQRLAALQAQHAMHVNRAQAFQRLAAGRNGGVRAFAGEQLAIELGGTVKTPAPQRAAGRKKLAKAGEALADGSYPIPDLPYLRKAIRSVGRAPASKRPALKALIRKRARALGATNAPGVKGTWAFQGSNDSGNVLEFVGPKGFIHGWIHVGAPGVGGRVHHPSLGHGTVTGHDGSHATVRFDKGGVTKSFEAKPGKPGEAGKLSPRPVSPGDHVRIASGYHSGKEGHVVSSHGKSVHVEQADGKRFMTSSDTAEHTGRPSKDVTKAWDQAPAETPKIAQGDKVTVGGREGTVTRLERRHGIDSALVSYPVSEHQNLYGGQGYAPHWEPLTSVKPSRKVRRHANDTEALEMAMPGKMPMVRGAADVQCSRSGPGAVNVMHKSTGMRVGTLTSKGGSWTGVHSTGKTTAPSGSMPGALSALIAMHNQIAGKQASPGVKAMANDGQRTASPAASGQITWTKDYIQRMYGSSNAVDLAGSLPFTSAATSMDGPRVTTMGGAGKVKAMAPTKLTSGLNPAAVQVYRKLRRKGMSHAQALPMARRAASMHAKAQAKAA